MPNPKRRHSATRRDKRRTHDHAAVPAIENCPNCGAPKQRHRVCPECGHYRGKLAIQKSAE